MLTLGLIDSKPSTAAILDGGRIVAAVAEERLCRMKMASGLPRSAIDCVMRMAGIEGRDVERVAVAQKVSVFEPQPVAWSGWFETDLGPKTRRFDRVGSTLAPLVGRFPLAWKAHHRLKSIVFRERIRRLPRALREGHGIHAPVTFHDHHYCHATSAYYTSGMRRALVLTLDGGGDGLSGSVWRGVDGRLERLSTVDSFHSLGNFYSYITMLCGFKAERHEGKITGLAACGTPRYADILRGFVRYAEPGQIRYSVPMYHASALSRISARLPRDFDRADLAASVQLVLEEVGLAWVRHWLERSGERDVALAGGVFANVKFNQRVHELPEVERIFVHPAMDDGGLSVGSALASWVEDGRVAPEYLDARMAGAYLGPEYTDEQIEAALRGEDGPVHRDPQIHLTVARMLAQGHVVARFHGRLEYGPRALGHRSILYQGTDPSVNDWLNERLCRTEFMPFGPATLVEHASDRYTGLAGAEDPARFMTVTFDCTERMRSESPGVVHRDGTARPQLVDAETAPDFHAILRAYHDLTGIPSLINTSFNMHEEPIVCTPEDALRAFHQGGLDYLAIGDWLVANPAARKHRDERRFSASPAS